MVKYAITALVAALLAFPTGGFFGYSHGIATSDRKQYNLSLRDAREILAELRTASVAILKVKSELGRVIEQPASSAAALDALVGVKRPVDDTLFRQRRYMAFQAGTVDNLFRYFLGVVLIWDRLERIEKLTDELESKADTDRERTAHRLADELRGLDEQTQQFMRDEAALLERMTAIAALPER